MATPFPPFEPDPSFKLRDIPIRVLVPNLITLIALCAGLTAIRLAIEGRLELAVGLIVAAAVLDGIDGRVARYLKGTSKFGAELDSLADFVNFGVVPAVVLYFWGLKDLKSLGWVVALIFAICAVLRLARFNVMLDRPNKPPYQANFFTGMPAPAGACVVLLPLYLDFLGFTHEAWHTPFALLYVLFVAFMMASTIPTYSGKKLGARIGSRWVLPLFVGAVAFAMLLASYTWEVMTAVIVVYLASLPLGVWYYATLKKVYENNLTPSPPP